MEYTNKEFDSDLANAFTKAWRSAQSVSDATADLVVSQMLPYYMGDIVLKRELQVLLNKFLALNETEMYTETDSGENEMYLYRKKAKMLLGMMDNKIGRIIDNPSKFGLGAFADGRFKESTVDFTESLQLFINLM